MKKSFLLVVALLAFNVLFANPVDANLAKELGQKFVSANFTQKQNLSLDLAYTMTTESGEPCFYVFNVSDYGFVFVSAEDRTRPILGYSENGAYDPTNVAPGLEFMMETYKESVAYARENNIAPTMDIVAEWKSLEATGKTKPAMRGQAIEPLCTARWNQTWPYNAQCPVDPADYSSGGHIAVGCVATAMAQIMHYWGYPETGQGSHSYFHPQYGQQSANFGATTYDWANMPDVLTPQLPQVQIDAVATLCYHLGVSVDMQYNIEGNGESGAFTDDVPAAIQNYFKYAPSNVTYYNSNYTAWMQSLRNAISMRRPVYYSGCATTGCHAFVCDGYDENEMYHFNYGWGGSGDGYFAPNAIEYSVSQVQAIFDFMPMYVYESAPKAPTALSVVPADNNALSTTLSWVNPTKSISNANLSGIDKIVVERNGKIIAELENVALGEAMTFVDDEVPCYSFFDYNVYAVVNGAYGEMAMVEGVGVGPTCDWTVILQSSAFQGMRNAYVAVYDETGYRFENLTTTNASLNTFPINVPFGKLQFAWTAPNENAPTFDITILVKDANNQTVYSYDGVAQEMQEGVFLTIDNNCGEEVQCEAPSSLTSAVVDGQLKLTWDAANSEPFYGYNVYRDGLLIGLTKETSFIDEDIPFGGHCYQVSALCENGNSEKTNETCGVLTEGCAPASNLWFEITSNNKPKLTWEQPETKNLSGYYIMRKVGDDGEWVRVKILGANKTDYTDNSSLTLGTWYYYKVISYYQEIDCMSAPAKAMYGNEYFVKVYYSETGVQDNLQEQIGIYPNPADDRVTIEATSINNVTIFNLMGQKVYETSVEGDNVEISTSEFESGVYMIQVTTAEYTTTKRISIAH